MSRALALAVVILTASHALAQRTGDDRDKHLSATRTIIPPTIDGKLDDATWKHVRPDSRFTQNFPDEGRPPSQRTDLYVAYDDSALYIGIRAWDTDPAGIVERLTRRDRDTDADKVQVDISSKNDRTTAYHFDVNVSGVLEDGVRFNDTDYSGDWDGLWLGATHRDAHGWTAELSIPLKTLRYEGGHTEFGFQVRRIIQRRQEIDEWAYTPRAAHGEVSYYGVLDGLAGLHATRLFQLMPYLAAGVYLRSHQDPASLNGTQLYGNIGADIKIGLTPALTLDAHHQPRLRPGRSRSGRPQPDDVRGVLPGEAALLPRGRRRVRDAAVALLLAPHRPPARPARRRRVQRARDAGARAHLRRRQDLGPAHAAADHRRARRGDRGGDGDGDAHRRARPDRSASRPSRSPTTRSCASSATSCRARTSASWPPRSTASRSRAPRRPPPPTLSRRHHAVGARPLHARRLLRRHRLRHPHARRQLGRARPGRRHRPGRAAPSAWSPTAPCSARAPAASAWRSTPASTTASGPASSSTAAGRRGSTTTTSASTRSANLHHFHPTLHYRILRPHSIVQEADIQVSAMFHTDWAFTHLLAQVYWVGAYVRFTNFWQIYFEVDHQLDYWDVREARDGAFVERAGGWSAYWFGKTDPRKRVWFQTNGAVERRLHGRAADVCDAAGVAPHPRRRGRHHAARQLRPSAIRAGSTRATTATAATPTTSPISTRASSTSPCAAPTPSRRP